MNQLFKALNDPVRRRILELLRKGDMTAGDIADQFNLTKPTISHHLDLLKQAGLVISFKNGQFVVYSLNMTVMDDLIKWMVSLSKNNKK